MQHDNYNLKKFKQTSIKAGVLENIHAIIINCIFFLTRLNR